MFSTAEETRATFLSVVAGLEISVSITMMQVSYAVEQYYSNFNAFA